MKTIRNLLVGVLLAFGLSIPAFADYNPATPYSVQGNNTASTAAPVSSIQSIILGTPSITDTGVVFQGTGSVAGYYQAVLQNTSNNVGASADFVVNNNLGTSTTYYGDFGINSSTFTGSGSLNLPSATYLYSTSGDLVLGTTTSNAFHIVVGSPTASDSFTISSAGQVQFSNWFGNFSTFATAGGTTVLTNSSPYWISFTGSLNQNCQLPVTTILGTAFNIDNNSTGTVTVQASGGATVVTLAPNTSAFIQNVTVGGTVAASWEYDYWGYVIASGKVVAINNSLTLNGTDATTMTFPSTSTTVAGLGTAQTFTAANTFASAATILGGTAYSYGALPSGATTAGTVATFPAATYTVTGTNTATAFQAVYHGAPTITNASAGTITDNFSDVWAGPTAVAGSQIQTRPHTLGILDATSAASSITGGLVVATTFGTAATSVGIGGGNVNAGGLITGGTITSTGLFTASSTSTFTGAATLNNAVTIVGATATTALTISNTARTSGVLPYIKYTIPTDTAQTASTESPGIQGVTGTRTWATTGTVSLQREIYWPGPTYASASASQTFTDVFNTYWDKPIQGTNAVFTRSHTLGVVDSTSSTTSITGGVIVATTLGTAATSVGIGGGNITAGGNILASTSTGRIGYLTGSGVGTAVSQGTSRTTAVTSNTPTGAITLFTAAGSATPASFTVNCTSISTNDTVQYAVTSGASNTYVFTTSAISTGVSFTVTFWAQTGTASDTPVVNYTIIKGSSN